MLIALRDVIINFTSTSVVKICLRGTLVSIELNVKSAFFDRCVFHNVTVYSYNKRFNENSNLQLLSGVLRMSVARPQPEL